MPVQSKNEFEGLVPYLSQLRRSRVLSREEETDLSRRAKKGDAAARTELVQNNLRFVVMVARKHAGRGAHLEDLIQEGNFGLLKAVEHFDAERGNRFATYAVWWIRAYITRFLSDNRSGVRRGAKEHGVAPDLSLDVSVGDDAETSHLDQLEGGMPSPEEYYLTEERAAEVRTALVEAKTRIGDLGWDIVHERLSKDQPMTLDELGRRRGLSRERVRQVEVKLKQFLNAYLAPIAA